MDATAGTDDRAMVKVRKAASPPRMQQGQHFSSSYPSEQIIRPKCTGSGSAGVSPPQDW